MIIYWGAGRCCLHTHVLISKEWDDEDPWYCPCIFTVGAMLFDSISIGPYSNIAQPWSTLNW
jgi:hypothetical protein